jgi:hypothetical protein
VRTYREPELAATTDKGGMTVDISDTLAPKSDQLDAVDLLGGPQTFTIERVSKGNAEQPVQIHLVGFPRPWRPGKSMRRVLVASWGPDAAQYVGRRVTLYCDNEVEFGGLMVGGTRIAALSHLDKPKQVPLLIKRGKSAIFVVQPLKEEVPPKVADYMADARAAKTRDEFRAVWKRAHDAGHLTDALAAELTPIGKALPDEKPAAVAAVEPVEPTLEGLS